MKAATAFFRLLGDEARLRILRLLEKERLNEADPRRRRRRGRLRPSA